MDYNTEEEQEEDLYCSLGEVEECLNNLALQKEDNCFSVSARQEQIFESTETDAGTKSQVESQLKKFGLEQLHKQKLSMTTILQIDAKTISDEPVKSNTDLVWLFLKKLMMVNLTARNVKHTAADSIDCDSSTELNFDLLYAGSFSDTLNPLDIITALFLCSDGLVQQELALRMSMCQFAVPLLLPNCDTNQCTLMLWAMRDIVKNYRPQSLSESKGFIEEQIVLSEIPMISFVRLGECSLSKSESLNKMLNNSKQSNDIFVHRDMQSGDCPRTISNGLVEMTWFLPCGNKNIDIFSEPVAVANLRGDIASFEAQYSFLCHTSSAIFVFIGNSNSDLNFLTKTLQKDKLYLVLNEHCKHLILDSTFRSVATTLGLNNNRILLKNKNMAEFAEYLKKAVSKVVAHTTTKMQIEKMSDVAVELGILVDQAHSECWNAKENANKLTEEICDIQTYKETQLPLQGQIWKELTSLENEQIRLLKAGAKNIDDYRSDLTMQSKQLRKKQSSYGMSKGMSHFINGISCTSTVVRSYFLKWLQINLDNLSRHRLSNLRKQFKERSNTSNNREEIKEIDRQLSRSSLGTEHFFREMGQIYEASVTLPETDTSRQQLQHLPRLCAQLMLDGFPLELVDGDASNIPLRWVSDVLAQLHELVSPKNKILVVTVLGVQSSGKSTLLNTMFGVQFAVSSGRCTRGAFMLLIRIGEDVKQTLNCDFLVIIDTEGLKCPERVQLDDSHEHDNKLATLVVGLSDLTIVNIAMENATEMKDILQIAVHAFLRMKEVRKKTKCQFVHQNVSDVSAHEKNLRDRKLFLEQLNEMTQAAASMEKKEKYKSFTDVMEYNPDTGNWYIPGLWNGNPPMAPVSVGYSEAVYELKKNIIQVLGTCDSSVNSILDFCEWIRSLWNAVKHENFIFNFRNSLEADAYIRLCTEYSKWEWDFKKAMYRWVTTAETEIKNSGTALGRSNSKDCLTHFKTAVSVELTNREETLHNNLTQYFEKKEGHVYLVEKFKKEFENNAKSLRREIECSVKNQLETAADIRQRQAELNSIKKKHSQEMKDQVCALLKECQQKNNRMTDRELDEEFNQVWDKTLMELDFVKQEPLDIFADVSYHLRKNLKLKGGHACQQLNQIRLQFCGLQPFICSAEPLRTPCEESMCNFVGTSDVLQIIADSIIDECQQFVSDQVKLKNNYHETHIQEILRKIDLCLKRNKEVNTEVEVSLKKHICATAARQFQKMHEDYLNENDPHYCLNQNKEQYGTDFKDMFYERDQCQKKAEEFTDRCLRPAVEDFLKRSLGLDIIGEMLTCQEFRTRTAFQYSILLDLLEKDHFTDYFKYIVSYEKYVKKWIQDRMLNYFSDSSVIFKLENKHIQSCISSISHAVSNAKDNCDSTLKDFVENICKELSGKLVISQDALVAFMALNNVNHRELADLLTKSIVLMGQSLQGKLKKTDIQIKLQSLHMNPENELFDRIIGCGKQCPFCKAPCEAGGREHTEHFVSLHRPQAFGAHRWEHSRKLVTDICSHLILTEKAFWSRATKDKRHAYKRYRNVYPDWKILADKSLEASDYWKYVLTKYNYMFSKAFNSEEAEIPMTWKCITEEGAKKSLKTSFNIH